MKTATYHLQFRDDDGWHDFPAWFLEHEHVLDDLELYRRQMAKHYEVRKVRRTVTTIEKVLP